MFIKCPLNLHWKQIYKQSCKFHRILKCKERFVFRQLSRMFQRIQWKCWLCYDGECTIDEGLVKNSKTLFGNRSFCYFTVTSDQPQNIFLNINVLFTVNTFVAQYQFNSVVIIFSVKSLCHKYNTDRRHRVTGIKFINFIFEWGFF